MQSRVNGPHMRLLARYKRKYLFFFTVEFDFSLFYSIEKTVRTDSRFPEARAAFGGARVARAAFGGARVARAAFGGAEVTVQALSAEQTRGTSSIESLPKKEDGSTSAGCLSVNEEAIARRSPSSFP